MTECSFCGAQSTDGDSKIFITAPPSSPGVAICWECIGFCIEAVTTVYEYNAILATEAQPS